jgi:hypothetical protein
MHIYLREKYEGQYPYTLYTHTCVKYKMRVVCSFLHCPEVITHSYNSSSVTLEKLLHAVSDILIGTLSTRTSSAITDINLVICFHYTTNIWFMFVLSTVCKWCNTPLLIRKQTLFIYVIIYKGYRMSWYNMYNMKWRLDH